MFQRMTADLMREAEELRGCRADFQTMNALLGYVTEQCCIGLYDQCWYPVRKPFVAKVMSIFGPACCRS